MLSERLRILRTERGLQQAEIAEKLNINKVNYNRYELGNRDPDYATLEKLADFFDVSIDYLLRGKILTSEIKTKDEKDIAKKLADLTDEERALAVPVIKSLLDGIQKNKPK